MDAQQAFTHFVQRCLSPERAERFSKLAATKKGQQKVLASLYHKFEPAVRAESVRRGSYDSLWSSLCFVFHQPLGFGVEFASVREAYDQLSLKDGWLILLRDASAGIHRPEAKWDAEKLIVG
ncbi:MAG: hypothetical protein ACKVX7_06325 [Planctomycetota bacterium]